MNVWSSGQVGRGPRQFCVLIVSLRLFLFCRWWTKRTSRTWQHLESKKRRVSVANWKFLMVQHPLQGTNFGTLLSECYWPAPTVQSFTHAENNTFGAVEHHCLCLSCHINNDMHCFADSPFLSCWKGIPALAPSFCGADHYSVGAVLTAPWETSLLPLFLPPKGATSTMGTGQLEPVSVPLVFVHNICTNPKMVAVAVRSKRSGIVPWAISSLVQATGSTTATHISIPFCTSPTTAHHVNRRWWSC